MIVTTPAVFVLSVLAAGPLTTRATAATLPETMKVGFTLSVLDDQGGKTEGRVTEVTPDRIRVSRRGRMTEIPLDRIVRIERADGLRNGALIGLATGVG